METTGKNALRGFGPGGRIPRDSATEVTSPGGLFRSANGARVTGARVTVEEVDSSTPSWRGGRDNHGEGEEEAAVSFSVKRPVFF